MKKYILPYNMASTSAATLSNELSALRLRRENSRFAPSDSKIVINWGCPVNHFPNQKKWLNHPDNVKQASNKLKAFRKLAADNSTQHFTPYFVTDYSAMLKNLSAGRTMVARQVLNGNSGDGIVILDPTDREITDLLLLVEDAPLFVEYRKKRFEYRVHFGRNDSDFLFYVQQKARSRSVPDHAVDWKIRNTRNGFIFKEPNMDEYPHPFEKITMLAENVAKVFNLDFGAIDIIHNTSEGSVWVLEVNTAPGINSEKTRNFYTSYFNLESVTNMANNPYIVYQGGNICRKNNTYEEEIAQEARADVDRLLYPYINTEDLEEGLL